MGLLLWRRYGGRYNASSPKDTQDGEVAYGRFPPSQPTEYRDGSLPDCAQTASE